MKEQSKEQSSPPNNQPRLLVVDDEANIRSALQRALSLSGYAVDEADSGLEALNRLKLTPYDLMILDIRMSGLDGVEVMKQAKRWQPDLLVIILTGHATLESAIAAVKSEAVDYLVKPVDLHELIEAVGRSLQKRVKQSQQQQLLQVIGEAVDALRMPESALNLKAAVNPTAASPVQFYRFSLDYSNRLLTVSGNPVQKLELTEGETAILTSLMRYPGQVLSCRELTMISWGHEMHEPDAQSIIRPYICRLRRKLNTVTGQSGWIRTVRRCGYIFQTPQTG